MDMRTGAIRELPNGADPTEHEILITNRQARRLVKLSPADRIEFGTQLKLKQRGDSANNELWQRKLARKAQRAARKANR